MFLLIRHSLSLRFSARFLGSVVPNTQIENFAVKNEPVFEYLQGSSELKELKAALKSIEDNCEDVPIVIGEEEIRNSGATQYQVMPHNHKKKIAKFYYADEHKSFGIESHFQTELIYGFGAADLMAGKYRMQLNAATMLGQAKTVVQAEIDSAAELVDFFRFNSLAAKDASKYQPISEKPSVTLNSFRFRGLEGFVAAVSPFNFTAIGGNLAFTPALMGCSVLWKPSDTALLSNYLIFKILREAGLPPGVVNFIPADGPTFGNAITSSPDLAGINFTGSVPTFNWLWERVGQNVSKYRNYPRLIGECGGKNYHFVHPSAHPSSVATGTIRSAFEFSGQKCSACSRMYVPKSLWPKIKEELLEIRNKIKVGDPTEIDTFMSAVIDDKAFKRIKSYIDHASTSNNLKIIGGGKCNDSLGYFIEPTIVETTDPVDRVMCEEIFGPVLAVFQYDDNDLQSALKLLGDTTPYALTGAVFALDEFLKRAVEDLKMTAGNFYINDKSTGSVVGQQPFGGSRLSGTNDKAGGPHYVLRWTSPQAIKETFVPLREWKYPYMES